ncbi:galectin-8-like isoform X2 [Cylas formicarius]|uniref:galectin-8-like isoform X2 n=1 Tax=Cylas formicarius TaxID=197179 RepID=UPI0029588FE2|nr:galectin-8-like isoform X2 [Cylas formicarius]
MKRGRCCGSCCFVPKRSKNETTHVEENFVPLANTEQSLQDTENSLIYSEDFKDRLHAGSSIVIRAKVKPECKRFIVNLMLVTASKCDIGFHFNPRLALRYVVRNSRINNIWGEEETTSVGKVEFSRNEQFELNIVCTEREFFVSLDGKHICAFVYRIPLENINRIQVEGPVDVNEIEYKQVEVYPEPSPHIVPFSVPTGSCDNTVADQQLEIPITANLDLGFKCGWQLEISGRVKILPSSFYINLQEGRHLWPHPVIPLHLNPRFYTSYGNHLFVRNSWTNGDWGAEERTPGFQFTPGSPFNVAIRKMDDHFSVWVDGNLAGEFNFRTPVDNIDTVFIHGDVQVFSVYLKDHVDDKYFSKSREKIHCL